jgi:hypothetical protein
MRQLRREAKASDSNTPKVYRREGYLTTIKMKPVMFTLPRCTSTELFFSCHFFALGRAAEGPRRGIVPQAQAA